MKLPLIISAAFCLLPSLSAFATPSRAQLIVPGKSLGQVSLGSNGKQSLACLRTPDVLDPGMSQTRNVWAAKSRSGKTNTLYIHTVSNGALNMKPDNDVTIDTIRVTSPWFRTRGGLHTGSTLAQIQQRFPHLSPAGSGKTLLDDKNAGIAFEFAQPPTRRSRCIAIIVHSSGKDDLATRQNVTALLQERGLR